MQLWGERGGEGGEKRGVVFGERKKRKDME